MRWALAVPCKVARLATRVAASFQPATLLREPRLRALCSNVAGPLAPEAQPLRAAGVGVVPHLPADDAHDRSRSVAHGGARARHTRRLRPLGVRVQQLGLGLPCGLLLALLRRLLLLLPLPRRL